MALPTSPPTPLWGWLVQPLLDPPHAWLLLARQIAWDALTDARRPYSQRLGRDAKPSRWLGGLPLLKHRGKLSAARVVQGRHAHLSWRTCCGIEGAAVWAQATPGQPGQFVDASTMPKWRQRLGPAGPHGLAAVRQPPWVRDNGVDGRRLVPETPAQATHGASPPETALRDKGRWQGLTRLGEATAAGGGWPRGCAAFAGRPSGGC
jgi:hypothetical protein